MKEIRELAERNTDFAEEFRAAMQLPMDQMSDRLQRVHYDGKPFIRMPNHPTSAQVEFLRYFNHICPGYDVSDTRNKHLMAALSANNWSDDHFFLTTYGLQIFKCGKVTCPRCKPVRMPLNVFNTLKPIPMPKFDAHGVKILMTYNIWMLV
jgi:hypothetical protein